MPKNNWTSDNAYLKELLQDIMLKRDVRSVFQPIISLRDGSILGYEALSRGPKDSKLENPEHMFTVAGQCGMIWDLESICRGKSLCAISKLEPKCKIFLNIDPCVIADRRFRRGFTKEYLMKYHIPPQNIIFEITEKNPIQNIGAFKKIIESFRDQGYRFAIDDVGDGYSGLNLISAINPSYLKIDMNIIRGIDKHTVKEALVRSLFEFTRITDASLIAEGIETLAELQTLIDIGVHYGQGYLIHRPHPDLSLIPAKMERIIVELNAKKIIFNGSGNK